MDEEELQQEEMSLLASEINPDNALPSEEEQQRIVDEFVELANKSNDWFGVENERKKDDSRVFSAVDAFNKTQKKEMGEGRIESKLNPLPLYINAVSNLFLDNPFQSDIESDKADQEQLKSLRDQLTQIYDNSDANNSVWGEGLNDTTETGGAFAYLTTEDGTIKVNLAYDPSSCIFDPNSTAIDGRDAEFFGIVENVSYERANDLAGCTLPPKDRITKCKTYSFGGFVSTPDSINLVHFFKRESDGVVFYDIVCDRVVKRAFFAGLSCLPVVPIYGQRFKDDNKKFYKGAVRDVKDLCKIVNGCYSMVWERVNQAQDPYWLLDSNAVEGTTADFESNTVKYKRYISGKQVSEGNWQEFKVPVREVPKVIVDDIMPLVDNTLLKISKMIGVPEDGLGFAGAVQQTAAEFLGKSTALVNNVSHFYRHLQQSVKHMGEIIVEMLCIYNGIENTFSIKVSKGPADALRRERMRQQWASILQFVPEAVKPVVASELVKTFDVPNADKIAAVILLTLPAEVKQILAGGLDTATLQAQLQQSQQQVAALTTQVDELTKAQQADIVSNQAQIVMSRMNNEAALRSKLIEIEADNARHEQDLALKYAELEADKQAAFLDVMNAAKEANTKAREVARKELETATKLRLEAEERRAEMASKILGSMPPQVSVQPVIAG